MGRCSSRCQIVNRAQLSIIMFHLVFIASNNSVSTTKGIRKTKNCTNTSAIRTIQSDEPSVGNGKMDLNYVGEKKCVFFFFFFFVSSQIGANTEGDHNGPSLSFTCYKYQWIGLLQACAAAISRQQWVTFQALKGKPGLLCCC